MDMQVKPTQLNAKAMLVKLTMKRATMATRDAAAEEIIQQQLNDAALVVNRKLFRDKKNPVNRALAAASEVYTYHKQITQPWQDSGVRLLANSLYLEYCAEMKKRIAHTEAIVDQVVNNWAMHVQADLSYRARSSSSSRGTAEDYPTAEQFRSKMQFDFKFSPLPDESHFLFDISDEDKQAFNQAITDVAAGVRRDMISRMLEPTQHLVSKLSLTIGEPGSIFRDSAFENIVEGCELARKLNIDEDEGLNDVIGELKRAIEKIATHKDQVRESQDVRDKARARLEELQKKLGDYFQ